MAKISARGATEVARIMAVNPTTKRDYILVMCSDGRVLSRPAGSKTGYTLLVRGISHTTEGMLRRVAVQRGLHPVLSQAMREQARGRLESP